MFVRNTAVILGAGASHECGLPLGSELKRQIAADLKLKFGAHSTLGSGDARLLELLQQKFGNNLSAYLKAANTLASSVALFPSIDEVLHYFSDDAAVVHLGKLAIVLEILRGERKSPSQYNESQGRPNVQKLEDTWYNEFLSMVLAGRTRQENDAAFSSITFINFDYDRSLEHYLYWALQDQAAIAPAEAARLASSLKVIRPYGCVGPLDWQQRGGVPFGPSDDGGHDLFELANKIRTFTEQCETDVGQQSITRSTRRR